MPSAAASVKVTEQRCPVTRRPRPCASWIAARTTSRVTPPRNLNQVAPLSAHWATTRRTSSGVVTPTTFTGPPALAAEVRAGHVEARARNRAAVHPALEIQLDGRRPAARGHRGGDAEGEVEQRRGDAHLGELLHAAEVGVLVQAHETGQDGVALEIEHQRAGGDRQLARRSDGLDPVAAQDDGLVGARGGAGPVHQPHVGQGDDGGVHGDERRDPGLERRLLRVE